jgi:hypothetical protein
VPQSLVKNYAVGIFMCPVAALISGRNSHFTPDITKQPRYTSTSFSRRRTAGHG